MPANFREIAEFQRREAARHFALAQQARDRKSRSEAEYHTQMAVHHARTAVEQEKGMTQPLGYKPAPQNPNRWNPEPRLPAALSWLLSVFRGAERFATSVRQLM